MRGREEKHPFQGWLNVGADMQRVQYFVFQCSCMQERDKNVWYPGLSHGRCWKASQFDLYFVQFLNHGRLKRSIQYCEPSEYLYSYISNMSLSLCNKTNTKKNGKIKHTECFNTFFVCFFILFCFVLHSLSRQK